MPAFFQNYLDVLRNMYEHHRLYFVIHVFLLGSAGLVFLIMMISMI